MKKHLLWLCLVMLAPHGASAQDLPRGQITDPVEAKEDAAHGYALYVPSTFTADRQWPVILAFDAGGRGRRGVEPYQAAAEKYGYLVAGSNNARNGPVEDSLRALEVMIGDLSKRFPLDSKRIYTAGMSGGARLAMLVALDSDIIAGVFASSGGFPGVFEDSVRFPIFGTAGTDDFNYREMSALDDRMTSPHRVEVFEGGHTWPPPEVATSGVEWMEIQAMKSGLRARDQRLIDDIFARRTARAEAQKTSLEKLRELKSLVADFQELRDVAKLSEAAAALERQPDVDGALKAERLAEDRERQTLAELYKLRDEATSPGSDITRVKERVTQLLAQSKAANDSTDRRIARRVLTALSSASRGVSNPSLQELLNQIRSSMP